MVLKKRIERPCRRAAAVLVGILLGLFVCSPAQSAERELPQPRSQLDVVLLFDASGSMLKTDAQNLRYEGAKLLLSFLGEGDRLGVVQFAANATVVQDLQPFTPARSREVEARIGQIVADGEFTDIAEGIKVSKSLLETDPRPDAQRVIVLLSDGKVEPDPSVSPAFARTLELVHDILPDLKTKEIKVFTLAFSNEADQAFLGEIAATTDGLTWFTQTSEDIHKSFAELFLAMKRPQVVAQTGRGFEVDSDVNEATFYINHEPEEVLTLIAPKGTFFTIEKHPESVTWFNGKNFDVITILEPDPGLWQVSGTEARDGFATVMTDLRLLTDWPVIIRVGDRPLVQARLYEQNKPVSLPELGGVLKFGYQIIPTDKVSKAIVQEGLNDDGIDGDKVALDGIFSRLSKPMQIGSYKLVVAVKGPTFQRSQQIPFTVRPRLVTLEIKNGADSFDETTSENHATGHAAVEGEDLDETTEASTAREVVGDEDTELVVSVSKEAAAYKKMQVDLVALSVEREKTVLAMHPEESAGREFRIKATELPKDGAYKVKAVMRAEAKKGESVEAESTILSFNLRTRIKRSESSEVGKQPRAERQDAAAAKPGGMKIPVVPLVLISLINLIALGAVYFIFRKSPKKLSATAQKYFPQRQLLDAMGMLEERVAASSLTIDDPMLQAFQVDDGGDAPEKPAQREVVADEASSAGESPATEPLDEKPEGGAS